MGLGSLFQKKTAYFDKKITPKCGYCQFGKRSKSGTTILCEKQGIMDEEASCGKFVYSPLKRIPVKQLNVEGAIGDDEMYAEVAEQEQKESQKQNTEPDSSKKTASENTETEKEEAVVS